MLPQKLAELLAQAIRADEDYAMDFGFHLATLRNHVAQAEALAGDNNDKASETYLRQLKDALADHCWSNHSVPEEG